MKCNKCGSGPQENDKIAWKCNSCNKMYGVKLSFLQKVWDNKTVNPSKSVMKCKQCGNLLDDGNEKIIWKCSCGNVQNGKLEEFISKDTTQLEKKENSSLIAVKSQNRFCPGCGIKLQDNIRYCPNCGLNLGQPNGLVRMRRKIPSANLRKMAVFAVMLIALICGGVSLARYLNSPITKLGNYLKDNKIENAQNLYNDKITGSEDIKAAREKAMGILEDKVSNYAEDAKKYKQYTDVLEFIQKNFSDADVSAITERADKIKASKDAYELAEGNLKIKEYSYAIKFYNQVIKEDGLYDDAREKINICKSGLKTEIITRIEKQISSPNPAIGTIATDIDTEEFLINDSDVVDKFSELIQVVKKDVLEQVSKLAQKNKYKEAFEKLNNDIPTELKKDDAVINIKKTLATDMVNWVMEKVDVYVENKNFEKALDLLTNYKQYDTGKTLSNKLSLVNKKARKANIAVFKELKKKLAITYDPVDQDYKVAYKGYSTKYLNISNVTNIEARAIVSKRSKINLFDLVVGFSQSDWIFIDTVQFASGHYRARYTVSYSDRYSQVEYGGISEWVHLSSLSYGEVFDSMDKLVPKITTSAKAVLRFRGDGHGTRNHIITNTEKSNIRTVKKFCDMLDKFDYLYKYV